MADAVRELSSLTVLCALAAGAREVAVFGAATDAFSQKNTRSSMEEGLARCEAICAAALGEGLRVRGYVSCVLGCPYEGAVDEAVVVAAAARLHAAGCYEVSLGDTIGVGTPAATRSLVRATVDAGGVPVDAVAVHFHNTYGQALANTLVSLEEGVSVVDASVAGLGGCPYAKGATGNLATEELVYMLHGMGVETGVDLDAVIDAGAFICGEIGKPSASLVATATLAKRGAREIA